MFVLLRWIKYINCMKWYLMYIKERNVKIRIVGILNWFLIIEINLIIWDCFILVDVIL